MLTTHLPNSRSLSWKYLIGIFFVGSLVFYTAYWHEASQQATNENKVEMKSSGRNGQHANPKTKQSATEKYEEAKAEFEKLNAKPSKTPEDKTSLEKLRDQMKHWKKKKDWGGEHHSQKSKGN